MQTNLLSFAGTAALSVAVLCASASVVVAQKQEKSAISGYPPEISEIGIVSTADGATQKALWFSPETKQPKPLLVALHTWSGNYKQAGGERVYAQWCVDNGWIFIHPDFRGPNSTPSACGSELAVSDILDAVAYAKHEAAVDENRIHLIGVSGGGHASLLMAGRNPEIWAGVSAWCGISDLAAWHDQHSDPKPGRYAKMMEAACGGAPGDGPAAAEEYRKRSPLTWLEKARGKVALDINHGVTDGRSGSVPFTHSLRAFNLVADEDSRLTEAEMKEFYDSQTAKADNGDVDPLYGDDPLPYRKNSGTARVTIFNGGHEIVHRAALNWLAQQNRQSQPIWTLDPAQVKPLRGAPAASESGK